MVGTETRSNQYTGLSTREWGYFPDRGQRISYEYNSGLITGAPTASTYGSSLVKHTVSKTNTLSNTLSGFATAAYSLRNRYIVNANVRADASNRFGQYTNNRFLPVWSIAGRWRLSEEAWLRDNPFS